MRLCRNIHRSVWQLLGGLTKFKMAAVAMVTKVQNGHQIQKSCDLGEIWFPTRLFQLPQRGDQQTKPLMVMT